MAVIIPVLLIEIERLKFSGFDAAVKCRVVILSNLTVTHRIRNSASVMMMKNKAPGGGGTCPKSQAQRNFHILGVFFSV